MASLTDTQFIQKGLHTVIEAAVKEAIEDAIRKASYEVEQKIRGDVGAITARCLEKFSFERMGQDLVIRVEFPGVKK